MLTNAPTEKLAKYRGKKLNARARLARLKLHVDEIFGYGSLCRSIVDDNGLDPHKIAKENKWHLEEGVLNWHFTLVRFGTTLTFGEKPDKNELRRMVKEEKAKK